jgi:hypothetical protein
MGPITRMPFGFEWYVQSICGILTASPSNLSSRQTSDSIGRNCSCTWLRSSLSQSVECRKRAARERAGSENGGVFRMDVQVVISHGNMVERMGVLMAVGKHGKVDGRFDMADGRMYGGGGV